MRRMLVLVHRQELVFQAVGHARNAGLTAGIEMGNLKSIGEDVVVSTVQTQCSFQKCRNCHGENCPHCKGLGKYRRFEKFKPQEFGLVIIDEAHHAAAKSYRLVLDWYKQNKSLKVLLVTATPKRADKIGLHNVCDSVAFEMQLREAIEQGWLVPIRQLFVTVDSLDLSKVKSKSNGDLREDELERVFLGETDEEEQHNLHAIVKPCIEESDGRPVLVFAAGKEHATKLTAAFNAYDGVTAECVIEDTDPEMRRHIVKRYKEGETQILVNCMVFTEGFDAPETFLVGVARPTNAVSLYSQMIGRATRPLKGVVDGPRTPDARQDAIAASDKPHCVILDFVGNSGKHKLISVANILAGDDVHASDVEAAVKAAKKKNEPVDMEALIEKAKQAREKREERKAERDAAKRQIQQTTHRADNADYSAQAVDLFGGAKFDPFSNYTPEPTQASVPQVKLLMKLGVDSETAMGYSKRQAGAVIDSLKKKTGGDYIFTFGNKHAGKKLRDVPSGYLRWMQEKGLIGADLRQNINIMRGKVEIPAIIDPNAAFSEAYEEVPF